uniref:C-type lectin domain-containing protein n=1 Tax=Stegastes partitus TaxID=144197 RepID=A0A3B5AM70_9TELE
MCVIGSFWQWWKYLLFCISTKVLVVFCFSQLLLHYIYPTTTSSPKHYFITRTLSWLKAQSYCRSFHTDLVSIRNEKEMAVIQKVVPKHMSASVGLSRKTWYSWSAGTQHEFKNWLTGHPLGGTGDCATSLIGGINAGKWVEQPCDQKLPFMCLYSELPPNKLTLIVLH